MTAIVLVLGIVAAVIVIGGGDDDEPDRATAGQGRDSTEVTTESGELAYPVSFSEAREAGLEDVDWGERCDPETGHLAYPDITASECYAPFDGDNGGATEVGVTADTIKIVVYQGPEDDPVRDLVADVAAIDDTNAEQQETLDRLIDFYEAYHETYGRHVDVEYYVSEGIASDATTARADAVRIAEDIKPFQVWGGPVLTEAFGEELAARGVQCIGCAGGDQQEMAERAPYGFGTTMTSEQGIEHNVEALAKQVAGRPAEYAGDESMRDSERVFGYLHIELNEETAGLVDTYQQRLADEGVELAEVIPYSLDPATLQEAAANAITRLKEAGVTTVILGGDPLAPREFTREATAQRYFPEWFVNLSVYIDTNVFARTYDQEQWTHAFGLTNLAARVDPATSGVSYLYEWFYAEPPVADDAIGPLALNPALFYPVLQEVGPDLTPEAFRDAAFRLEPTPARLTVPSVSFGDHGRWPGIEGDDYQGPDDVTKIWWDSEAEGPDEYGSEGTGMWRFVDGGTRYLAGQWPDEPFDAFVEEGTSTIYEEPPAEEAVPDYEPLDARPAG